MSIPQKFEADVAELILTFKTALFHQTSITETNRTCAFFECPVVFSLCEKFTEDLDTLFMSYQDTFEDPVIEAELQHRVSTATAYVVKFVEIRKSMAFQR